jgi:hypothetical protein
MPTTITTVGHVPRPLLAVIKLKCEDCCCGQRSEVAKCTATGCALWPYRLGRNPFAKPRGRPFPKAAAPLEFPSQTARVLEASVRSRAGAP